MGKPMNKLLLAKLLRIYQPIEIVVSVTVGGIGLILVVLGTIKILNVSLAVL